MNISLNTPCHIASTKVINTICAQQKIKDNVETSLKHLQNVVLSLYVYNKFNS